MKVEVYMDYLTRTKLLIGDEGLNILKNAKIIVFGLGGVGSYCVEALARGGVGNLHLIDDDVISITNINRQVIALMSTIGQDKTKIMQSRIYDINKNINVTISKMFYNKKNKSDIDLSKYDYVIDAIDTVTAKLILIEESNKVNTKIISSMGTGNKKDPTKLKLADVYETNTCPLARVMRNELRKRNVKKLNVVFSTEKPIKPLSLNLKDEKNTVTLKNYKRNVEVAGTMSFVPPTAGFIIASKVINDLLKSNSIEEVQNG